MWSIFTEITNGGKKFINSVSENDILTVEKYNEYLLLLVAPNILQNLPKLPNIINIPSNNQSIFLKAVTLEEFLETNNKIKINHSSSIDEIPTSIIK